jgi:hypothetical protein
MLCFSFMVEVVVLRRSQKLVHGGGSVVAGLIGEELKVHCWVRSPNEMSR